MHKFSSKIRILIFALILIKLAGQSSSAANLSFSGGNGGPLTITLSSSVSFTTTTRSNNGLVIGIPSLGNLFNPHFPSISSSSLITINGQFQGKPDYINSGYTAGDLAAIDVYFYNYNISFFNKLLFFII